MTAVYEPTMAQAQAMGLCWLARQQGLPEVHKLRQAVSQLHPADGCAWCDWPLPELLRMVELVDHQGDAAWWRMPSTARLRAIAEAQR